MSVKRSGRRAFARQLEDLANISTFAGGLRISRASLIALAALGEAAPAPAPARRPRATRSIAPASTPLSGRSPTAARSSAMS
jgi:hypothetical protein